MRNYHYRRCQHIRKRELIEADQGHRDELSAPGRPGSALIAELPEPGPDEGSVLAPGLSRWPDGLARNPDDVKVVVDLTK